MLFDTQLFLDKQLTKSDILSLEAHLNDYISNQMVFKKSANQIQTLNVKVDDKATERNRRLTLRVEVRFALYKLYESDKPLIFYAQRARNSAWPYDFMLHNVRSESPAHNYYNLSEFLTFMIAKANVWVPRLHETDDTLLV